MGILEMLLVAMLMYFGYSLAYIRGMRDGVIKLTNIFQRWVELTEMDAIRAQATTVDDPATTIQLLSTLIKSNVEFGSDIVKRAKSLKL